MPQVLQKSRRYRGFVLTSVGLQKLQTQIQQLEIHTKIRQSPRSIAERVQLAEPEGIHPITVRKILRGQAGVDKRSIDRVFRVMQIPMEEQDYAHAELCYPRAEGKRRAMERSLAPQPTLANCPEWEELGEATRFYGRTEELAALTLATLTPSRRQVLLLLGMGGVGKTMLATQFIKQRQAEFEFVVWKSLRHAPTLTTLLRDILQHLLGDTSELPVNVRELTGLLIEILQQHQGLLVLDHADAVLASRLSRESDAAYEEFLQIIASVPHQSCLLLTSRERPKVLGLLPEAQIQVFQLAGLSVVESQQIFQKQVFQKQVFQEQVFQEQVFQKQSFSGSPEAWRSLIHYYGGNPLMLRRVAARIQTYFDGNISEFLNDLEINSLVFGDLRDLLKPQFIGLSALERSLISYLAIQPDWVSVKQLRQITLSPVKRHLLELLDSLTHRSLLDQQGITFKLQPIVADYVNGYLPEYQAGYQIEDEIKYVSEPQIDIAIAFEAKREVA